jgi:hypothetical protein
LAGRFAAAWGASETAALAALWHDLGRYAAQFQAISPRAIRRRIWKASPQVRESGSSLQRRRALGDGKVPKRRLRPQIGFAPDWTKYGRAAPFKGNN